MAANSSHIARLRRMIAEPTDANGYTSEVLAPIIEQFPLIDLNDVEPSDDGWVATYDLNAAAAEIWMEKAGAKSLNMDFAADGGSFKHSQQYEQAMKMARYYGARRAPGTITVISKAAETVEDEV